MLLLAWDTGNKRKGEKWRWIPVDPLLLTKHCLQCMSVSGSAMAWSSGQLTLKLWALGCKGPNGGAGQLLSSAVISCRVYALELTNGLARRLLDAPLKQTLWSSAYVWAQKWPQDPVRQNIDGKKKVPINVNPSLRVRQRMNLSMCNITEDSFSFIFLLQYVRSFILCIRNDSFLFPYNPHRYLVLQDSGALFKLFFFFLISYHLHSMLNTTPGFFFLLHP